MMDANMVKKLALATFMLSGSLAFGWPTGLNSIPIADILKHREIYIEATSSGEGLHRLREAEHEFGILVGLNDRIEIGFDHFFGGHTIFNGKIMLAEGSKWAISGGMQAIHNRDAETYVVGRYDFSERWRIHLGWLEDGEHHVLFGADYTIDESATFYVDSISGRNGSSTLGINWIVPKNNSFDVTAFVGLPHQRSERAFWSLTVGYSTKF